MPGAALLPRGFSIVRVKGSYDRSVCSQEASSVEPKEVLPPCVHWGGCVQNGTARLPSSIAIWLFNEPVHEVALFDPAVVFGPDTVKCEQRFRIVVSD